MPAEIDSLVRRLADMEPGEVPVLSVYLDMRPHTTGERPALREGLVILKDRLREIEKTLLPRGPALDSFRADAARIQRYLDEQMPTAAQGLAIFACHARSMFEVVEAGVPFENEIALTPLPDLYQLVRLSDEQETVLLVGYCGKKRRDMVFKVQRQHLLHTAHSSHHRNEARNGLL